VLSTVLFPGGSLPLRVFEARYMDMIKRCISQQQRFGVCLLTSGTEVAQAGAAAQHERLGCEASVQDFDMDQPGILEIRCLGTQRFEVQSVQTQKDGLIVAQVSTLAEEPDRVVPEAYQPLVQLLQRITNDLLARQVAPVKRMLQEPLKFESATWVGYRLTEFLPLPSAFKQKLLALDDPLGRMAILKLFLEQKGIIKAP
jgi:uncharacterized protein